MKEIRPEGIALQRAGWHDLDGRPQLVVTAMVGFSLIQPRELVKSDVVWKLFSQFTSEHSICDMWMAKPRGEVLVFGEAHSAQPVDSMEVGMACGTVSRRLKVSGDRHWQSGLLGWKPSAPTPFTSMALDWSRSFGGPRWTQCQVGVGADSVEKLAMQQPAPLPNIEETGDTLRAPENIVRSVNMSSVWPGWNGTRRWGTFDKRWMAQGFPAMPEDFDSSMFNLAQTEQRRDGYWVGDERYLLEGLHPLRERLEGQLPRVKLRCFAGHISGYGEVALKLDTVTFFPSSEVGVLTFRGSIDDAGVDARNVGGIMVAAEWSENPRDDSHYRAEYEARSKSSSPFSFDDAPLMPEDLAAERKFDMALAQPVAPGLSAAPSAASSVTPVPVALAAAPGPQRQDSSGASANEVPSSEADDAVDGSPDDREAILEELSRSYHEQAIAELQKLIGSANALAAAIEQAPDRDIAELLAEHMAPASLGAEVSEDLMAKLRENSHGWMPPDLVEFSSRPENRVQAASRLRQWATDAQAAFDGLQPPSENSEMLMAAFEEDFRSVAEGGASKEAMQRIMDGEHLPQLMKIAESAGFKGDSEQAISMMREGLGTIKNHVNGSLGEMGNVDALVKPGVLQQWVQAVTSGESASPPGLDHLLSTALPSMEGASLEGFSAALPVGAQALYADLKNSLNVEPDFSMGEEAVFSTLKNIRSMDDLLKMVETEEGPEKKEISDDPLGASLASTEAMGDGVEDPPSSEGVEQAEEDIRQLRADATSEPIYAAPSAGAAAMLRQLVTNQVSAGTTMAGRVFAGADLSGLNLEGVDFTGALLEGVNLRGACLRNANLDKAVLIQADLRDADLCGVQAVGANFRKVQGQGSLWRDTKLKACAFTGSDLRDSDFRSSEVEKCDLADANFDNVDFTDTRFLLVQGGKASLRYARLTNARWTSCSLSGVSLDGTVADNAHLTFCDFTDASGASARLHRSLLEGSRFLGVHLPGLDASGSQASGTSWVQSSLPGANFRQADLGQALLLDADLKQAQFDEANLEGAVFNGSNISCSSFYRARLAAASLRATDASGASFLECDLRDADMNGTVIDGCDFTQCVVRALQLRVTHQPA